MMRCWVVLLAAWLGVGVVACAGESEADLAGDGFQIDTGSGDTGATTTTAPGAASPVAPEVPDDVRGALADAVAATRAVRSADLTVDVRLDVPGRVVSTGLDGQMTSDGLGHLAAEVDGGDTAISLELLTGDGGATWLSMDLPRFRDVLPEGVRWVEVPPGGLADVVPVAGLRQAWPMLAVLRGVEQVEDLGPEEVAGTPVRMLRGRVSAQTALDGASDEERASVARMSDLPGGSPELAAQAGLDRDGRIRYLEIEATSAVSGGGQAAATTVLRVRSFNEDPELPTEPGGDEAVPLADVPEVRSLLTGAT